MDSAARDPFPAASLAVVAVPLGHPEDITLRAIEVLRRADRVAAEDTRTTGVLLRRIAASARLTSYHDWNEERRAEYLLSCLERGERVALVADAGTPGISDPGYDLVHLARERGHRVFPVPGPAALTAFLCASGLPTDAFTFCGFPPNRAGRRRALFESLAERRETLVFYESPRRVVAALEDACAVFGPRPCCLAREMTKVHEEFLSGTLEEVLAVLSSRPKVLGEICWGVRGVDRKARREAPLPVLDAAVHKALEAGLRPRDAARQVAAECGVSTDVAYREIQRRKQQHGA